MSHFHLAVPITSSTLLLTNSQCPFFKFPFSLSPSTPLLPHPQCPFFTLWCLSRHQRCCFLICILKSPFFEFTPFTLSPSTLLLPNPQWKHRSTIWVSLIPFTLAPCSIKSFVLNVVAPEHYYFQNHLLISTTFTVLQLSTNPIFFQSIFSAVGITGVYPPPVLTNDRPS